MHGNTTFQYSSVLTKTRMRIQIWPTCFSLLKEKRTKNQVLLVCCVLIGLGDGHEVPSVQGVIFFPLLGCLVLQLLEKLRKAEDKSVTNWRKKPLCCAISCVWV